MANNVETESKARSGGEGQFWGEKEGEDFSTLEG